MFVITSDLEKPKEDPVQVSSNCAHPSSSRTRESKKNRGMASFPNSHSGLGNKAKRSGPGPTFGFSGGIVCIWNTNMFVKEHVSKSDYFVAIMGTWIPSSTRLLVISIYAPQELSEKRDLWNYLQSFISRWDGETVLMGDFNEVRSERERFGSVFNQQGATAFNQFISSSSLIDPPLDGYAFTWSHKNASKMSKLDRFLLSEGLFDFFPYLSAICLDKNLSDHRPILLRESCLDYGPNPFSFFTASFLWMDLTVCGKPWNISNGFCDNALIR
ncbi:RNA-directed DNA polymerase, eukaryota [Tanacetum coccineum]|uniref:RNA-directed DNA polymerase, eukaryota n=1 Tax=Tanacetum coccineum TaxID=301880 RepID=A0ABQ5EP36_9ASTR